MCSHEEACAFLSVKVPFCAIVTGCFHFLIPCTGISSVDSIVTKHERRLGNLFVSNPGLQAKALMEEGSGLTTMAMKAKSSRVRSAGNWRY